MKYRSIIMRPFAWGLLLWFPVVFLTLFAADQNLIDSNKMAILGEIAAYSFVILSAGLLLSSLFRLVKLWRFRSDKRNVMFSVLLFFGTIIGALIFYFMDVDSEGD